MPVPLKHSVTTKHSTHFYCNSFMNPALFQKKFFELFSHTSLQFHKISVNSLFQARISISFFLFHFLKLKSSSNLLSSSSIYIFFCVLNPAKNYFNILLIHIHQKIERERERTFFVKGKCVKNGRENDKFIVRGCE